MSCRGEKKSNCTLCWLHRQRANTFAFQGRGEKVRKREDYDVDYSTKTGGKTGSLLVLIKKE